MDSIGILESQGIAVTEEKRTQYAQRIYNGTCTMEKLVASLFLFSKLELGRIEFHTEPVDLAAYFADYAAEEGPGLAERGLVLSLDSAPASLCAAIDRNAFGRIVENIVGNAIKYKDAETARLDIRLRADTEQLYLAFAYHGPGVPESALPRLFETFYRTDPARANTAKGSGLGLAIAKQIIEGLGGHITAKGTPGGGLTICICLPLWKGDNHETDSHH